MRDFALARSIGSLIEHARTELGQDNIVIDLLDLPESDSERLLRELFEPEEYSGRMVIVLYDPVPPGWYGAVDRVPREALRMRPHPPLPESRPAWPTPARANFRSLHSRQYRPAVLRKGARHR